MVKLPKIAFVSIQKVHINGFCGSSNYRPCTIHIALELYYTLKKLTHLKPQIELNLPVIPDSSGQSSSFSIIKAKCAKAASLIVVASNLDSFLIRKKF